MFVASQSDPHIVGMYQFIEEILKPVNIVTLFHHGVRCTYYRYKLTLNQPNRRTRDPYIRWCGRSAL